MINLLRKHQKGLWIIVTFLVIVSFVWFYNGTRTMDRVAGTRYIGKIYGRSIPETEVDREIRKFRIANALQMVDLQNALVGQAYTQDQAFTNFVFNGMVLRHEAARLQVEPTEDEVKAAIMALPEFQTNAAFDSSKYALFVDNMLTPQGFSASQLEDLVRDDLRLKKIRSLLQSSFEISPETFRTAYTEGFQKLDVSVIRFNLADFKKDVKITDDEVKKAFEQHPENYKSEEKRRVKYVAFVLSDADKKLKGKERTEILQKMSDKANDFTQAMLDKKAKFDEAAAKVQVPVTTTDLFTESKPDPKIADLPGVVAAAEHLTEADPDSDAVQGEDGFYVLHLEEIVPSKPLTLDEARPQIIEELTDNRAHETLNLKVADVRNKIEADLKAGKSFADAAQAAGVKAETLPPASLAEPNAETPDSRDILLKAAQLADNGISDFVQNSDGGMLIHLDKREPIDEKKFEKDKVLLAPHLVQQRLNLVFADWMRKQRQEAKIELPRVPQPAQPAGQPAPPAQQPPPGTL